MTLTTHTEVTLMESATHMPFWGVVTDVSNCDSMSEVVELVPYFGKQVDTMPVYWVDPDDINGVPEPLERYKAPAIDGVPLGCVVGAKQGIVQPGANVELAQWLIDNLGARPAAAGAWRNQCRSIIELSLPQAAFTLDRGGRQDQFDPRITILDSVDGTRSRDLALLFHQLFCMNQWPGVLADGNAKRYRHTSKVMERQGDAKLFLSEVVDRAAREKGVLQGMEDTHLPKEAFFEFAAQLLTGEDDATKALQLVEESEGRKRSILERKFETVATLFTRGTGNRGRTALDAFSAVTEWSTWGGHANEDAELMARANARAMRAARGIEETQAAITGSQMTLDASELRRTEGRFQSNLEGNSAKMVNRARKLLMNRVARAA